MPSNTESALIRIRGSIAGMAVPANPTPHSSRPDDPADIRVLARCAEELVGAVEAALPTWVQRAVADRWDQWRGGELPPGLADAARDAGAEASSAVIPALRALLARDVADQATNPLSVVRGAVVYPTRVLASTGMPGVVRDAHAVRLFPDDVYDLVLASFGDLDPTVHEPGLRWGAAKAHVVLRRRRDGS